jgi:hypothetical protein
MKNYVQVYRNLNKKLWEGERDDGLPHDPVYSVRGDDGLVKRHTCHLTLWDCSLRVGKKGKQRVRDEKRKNVHAYIQGREGWNEEQQRWENIGPACTWILDSVGITYNPYKNETFIRTDTGEPVYKARLVVFGCGEMGKEVRAII